MSTSPGDPTADLMSASAESHDVVSADEDGAAEGMVRPTHNASGLMPAQDESILSDVDPDAVPETDAWGREEK